MKKFTKLLALLLALAVSVMAFAACSSNDKDDDDKKDRSETSSSKKDKDEKDDEGDVESVVDDFFTAYLAFSDVDERKDSLDLVDSDSKIYDKLSDHFDIAAETIDEIEGGFPNMLGDLSSSGLSDEVVNKFKDGLSGIFKDIQRKAKKESSYDIDKIKVDGDEATVSVALTLLDPDSADIDMDDIDFESMVDFSEEEFLNYLMSSTGMSLDQVASLSEEEAQQYGLDYANKLVGDAFDNIIDIMNDRIDSVEATDSDVELSLERIDDEWLIVDIDGLDLDD